MRRQGRLLKRQREDVVRLGALATKLERRLDSTAFDDAVPSLEPALDEARLCAGKLRHWIGELEFLV
mgnify:CR=1 FL=1